MLPVINPALFLSDIIFSNYSTICEVTELR
jgi:hypothetical protein